MSRQGHTYLLALLLPLAGCAQDAPVPLTQSNEEGCTWLRSLGPQDPYADPVPIKQACVGPYLLEFPQNYFDEQMGADFQGSFRLALEYPSLQPFKAGERARRDVDMAMRTVKIGYSYPRKPVREVMRSFYTPWESQKGDPGASLEGRVLGAPVFGLTPYYADLPRIRAYERSLGGRTGERDQKTTAEHLPAVRPFLDMDWYVTRDERGEIDRLIKCTTREMHGTGIEIRDDRIFKRKDEQTPYCDQMFMVPAMNAWGDISYPRFMLDRWQDMEERARELLTQGVRKDFSEAGKEMGE
ncbi:hypothetical protein [Stenotrophomonas maltophilia]|uniref:hypothetical protein n=1 Tax=Stenotrophomonas maltophilia TaxID=40324 RepID=UPI002A9AC98F|nr:hypothetical protein [Stenotrophomonas maltophilia]